MAGGPDDGALAGIVENVPGDGALVALLPRDQLLLLVRVPGLGPLDLHQVLDPDGLAGDGTVDGLVRLGQLGLLGLGAHAGHPEAGQVPLPLSRHVADAAAATPLLPLPGNGTRWLLTILVTKTKVANSQEPNPESTKKIGNGSNPKGSGLAPLKLFIPSVVDPDPHGSGNFAWIQNYCSGSGSS